MFTKLKAALARFLNLGETEVHEIVTALEQDAEPMLDQLQKNIVADLVQAFAEGKVDLSGLAKLLAEEIAKILPTVVGEDDAPAAPAAPSA